MAAGRAASSDYAASLRCLFALGQGRSLPGRGRLRAALRLAGDPHLAVPAVLIAGTNGKGRISAALSAVLSQRYRAGAFIKPHLKSVRERWRINDQDLREVEFTAACTEALEVIEAYTAQSGEGISFFEANVLLGALAFRRAGCEIAVWEVGLGGLHDACNLCEPFLSLLTNVQLDHVAILGGTLEAIARDKAHIARPGRPFLLGPAREGWEADYLRYSAVVREVCTGIGARLEEVPLGAADLLACSQFPATQEACSTLPMDTASLLHAALPHLATAGFPLSRAEVNAGLCALRYRGRFERTVLAGRPVILDAAHNPDSMRWLGCELARLGRGAKYPLVFGCQATRDPTEMLVHLAPVAASLTPIAVPVLRPCPPARIAEAAARLDIPVSLPPGAELASELGDYSIGHATELDPPDDTTGWIEAVRHALTLGTEERPSVICGSIYNLGEILRAFEDGWPARG